MKIKNLALCSAATLALVGALVITSPLFASEPSSPQEMQQTQQLNEQQTQIAADDSATAAANAAQYQAQQDDYAREQAAYQGRLEQYHYDKSHYDRWHERYTETHYGDPAPFHVRYSDDHLVRLYLIADPTNQLAFSLVIGPEGNYVGKVRNVETGVDGRPSRVQIALDDNHNVWVHPGSLRFDADDHVVVTNLTRGDLWRLSAAS